LSDYDAIAKARSDAAEYSLITQVTGLPPGYREGYTPTLDVNYQITMSAGVATVFGQELRIASSTQLVDSMFVGSKIGPAWFYVYLARNGEWHIDRLEPEYSEKYFYYRHPIQEWRALARLWVSDADPTILDTFGNSTGRVANEIIYVQEDVADISNYVVVAPYDGTVDVEAQYNCAGTHDEIFVNAGIQFLSEAFDGGELHIARGNMHIYNRISIITSEIVISGEGAGTLLTREVAGLQTYLIYIDGLYPNRIKNVEVRGFTLNLSICASVDEIGVYVLYCDGAIVTEISSHQGGAATPVVVVRSNDTMISKIYVSGMESAYGLHVADADYCKISDVDLAGSGASTVVTYALHIDTTLSDSTGISLSNISIHNIVTSGSTAAGLRVTGGDLVTAVNVHVDTVSSSTGAAKGFVLISAMSQFTNCTVSTISGATTARGFEVEGSDIAFTACHVDNTDTAFYLKAVDNIRLVSCETDTVVTNVDESLGPTNVIQIANSWNMAAGVLTIPHALSVTGILTLTAAPVLSALTASQAVFTDGSKALVSNAITGTGNVVMSASPTLTGTAVFEVLTVGGGYGSTGVTISSVGAISADGAVTFGSTLTTGSTAGFMDTPAVSTHYPITIGSEADTAGGLQITSVSVARWAIVKDNTAETGSNVGANLRIIADDDAGAQLINPVIFARRADGYVGIGTDTLTGMLTVGGTLDVVGQFTVGGGYGSTGTTISSAGVIQTDGAVTFASTLTVSGNVTIETLNVKPAAAGSGILTITEGGAGGEYFQILVSTAGSCFIRDDNGNDAIVIVDGTADNAIYIDNGGKIGLGTASPSAYAGLTIEDGAICLKERTTPAADADYGKLYFKADNNVYVQDGAGIEHQLAYV